MEGKIKKYLKSGLKFCFQINYTSKFNCQTLLFTFDSLTLIAI
ncbi:hypothetical protein M595_0309 [Lyngbya aestuarii BL J]|uniref:Uncharacterized protein n=1 Tax=Lyngbya aestuarii BL J TaxID=1348334 RepID=U7QP80_9CYAN|nr:hypothetical protein M595_0309 [Lyngbya aestuarii BL J]